MKPRFPLLLIWGVVLAWLPYLALRLYWQYLITTVPDAANGELSGPVGYFLPRLLVAAVVLSVALTAGFRFALPRTTPNSNDRNAS